MIQRLLLATLGLLLSVSLQAQTGKLSGTVIDIEDGSPLQFVSVGLFDQSDSSLVTGGVTDVAGQFSINLKDGLYYAQIEFLSYEDEVVKNIKVTNGQAVDLNTIQLKIASSYLEEITVKGERTQMELALDKKIYNIGTDLSNLGGTATDILDNLPSVQVDVEGNVSLRGSENVRILIDGKPSGLVGLSSNDALRQLNGNMVERVEIVTNPSARYDAEGEAGIINIVLKKEKAKGINGSFVVNTGWPHNHGGSMNLNLRREKFNFFTNLGASYRKNPGGGGGRQEFGEPIEKVTIIDRDRERGGINYTARFGSDIFLNDYNTLTLAFLYRFSDENNDFNTFYSDHYPQDNLDSLTERLGVETEGDENLEYSINYTRTFEKKDQKLSFDFQYQNNNELEDGSLVENSGVTGNLMTNQVQQSINDEIEERWMTQGEYLHPFQDEGLFETGFRFTDRLVGNDYVVEDQSEQGVFVVDSAFTNDFEYREKVFAAYSIIGNKLNRMSWQLGLRYEMTDLTTVLKTTDERNHQNYHNLFPSAFVTYNLTDQQSLQASYSRRIRRPRGRFLNPFAQIFDNRNFRVGNPNLRPVYTDSYELGYLLNLNNSSIYGGVYYRHANGVYQRIRIVTGEITFQRPYNITEQNDVGAELNFSHEFATWYNLNGNMNLFHSITNAGSVMFDEQLIEFDKVSATSFSGRLNNNFKIAKSISAQVNVSYRAPRNTVQGKRFSMTSVDLGFSRDVMKGNGTLSLSIRDLFNSRKYRGEVFSDGYYERSDFQWRRRSGQLTFTYRLNQKKQRSRNGRGDDDFGDDEF
ncbi:MAG: TonB-dependent receptor [Cyclobacteriaceae bacterium]